MSVEDKHLLICLEFRLFHQYKSNPAYCLYVHCKLELPVVNVEWLFVVQICRNVNKYRLKKGSVDSKKLEDIIKVRAKWPRQLFYGANFIFIWVSSPYMHYYLLHLFHLISTWTIDIYTTFINARFRLIFPSFKCKYSTLCIFFHKLGTCFKSEYRYFVK